MRSLSSQIMRKYQEEPHQEAQYNALHLPYSSHHQPPLTVRRSSWYKDPPLLDIFGRDTEGQVVTSYNHHHHY